MFFRANKLMLLWLLSLCAQAEPLLPLSRYAQPPIFSPSLWLALDTQADPVTADTQPLSRLIDDLASEVTKRFQVLARRFWPYIAAALLIAALAFAVVRYGNNREREGIAKERATWQPVVAAIKVRNAEIERLRAALAALEQGKPARTLTVAEDDQKQWRMLQLLTSKPVLYVCNVEEACAADGNSQSARVAEMATKQGAASVVISAKIEEEISQLAEEEAAMFLEEMGLHEAGLDRLIRAGYQLLGLQTYFTVGPKEARAWTIPAGTLAPQAAGVPRVRVRGRPVQLSADPHAQALELAATHAREFPSGILAPERRARVRGAVFYHRQDADRLAPTGEVCVAYGQLDVDGVGVATDPGAGLEDRHVVVRVEQVGTDEARDPGSDDGDLHARPRGRRTEVCRASASFAG